MSYLFEHGFYVNTNEQYSKIGSIKSVVPQDSILGSVLYIIYTSDMPNNKEVMILTYAEANIIIQKNCF